MPGSHSRPTFRTKELKHGSGWYVEVEWPDGMPEQVTGFKSEIEAHGWITRESEEWLRTGTVGMAAPSAA
jgi:hypothetical protein